MLFSIELFCIFWYSVGIFAHFFSLWWCAL